MKVPCERCKKIYDRKTRQSYLCDDCWEQAHDVLSRAIRIATTGKVKKFQKGWYKVKGQTDEYNVQLDGAKVACECRNYVTDGMTKGFICSHIQAVIIFESLRRLTLSKIVRKNGKK